MNVLEIQGLTKKYKSFCLDYVSFSLPEGTVMGLIGENGAGKTTVMKAILNLIRREEGEIRIFGQSFPKGEFSMKEDIGIVIDEGNFPDCFTIRDVSRVMKRTYRNWQEEYFFSLAEKFRLPKNKTVKELSKGNRMKLLLFTAMSHQPRLLILDEATSGLDPVARDEILDLFNEFTREEGHSILISSHIVSDLEKICDYITFLHRGKILFTEEKDLLKEQYGLAHLTEEEIRNLPKEAIRGLKTNPYGGDVLVERKKVPAGLSMDYPSIEDIMLFMTKEAVK